MNVNDPERTIRCNARMVDRAQEFADAFGFAILVDDSLPDGEMFITITVELDDAIGESRSKV